MRLVVYVLIGMLFGFGLIVSGMIYPAKVLGFLDLFGHWDASLAFVMGGAVIVATVGFRFVLERPSPLFSARFAIPTRKDIDARLLVGASLFGIGWGLVGLCPGPAIVALSVNPETTATFFIPMLLGMYLPRLFEAPTKPALHAS